VLISSLKVVAAANQGASYRRLIPEVHDAVSWLCRNPPANDVQPLL
jgi:hypothetical protein